MRLTRLYIRFYKSFNYDYERKYARSSEPDPWEIVDGAWYPYIRLSIDPSVTTIVGANESGKSHLLDAIDKLITGTGITRSDVCRYSQFFSVERGQRRYPDFGGEFEVTSQSDIEAAIRDLAVDVKIGQNIRVFRVNGQAPLLYLPGAEEPIQIAEDKLSHLLPAVFRVDARVPLPASIPLYELSTDASRPFGSRRSRGSVLQYVFSRSWPDPTAFAQAAPGIYQLLNEPLENAPQNLASQYALGRALLFNVAQIDPSTFSDLAEAIADEREGYVNGIIQRINSALASHLNFPRWWAQDREFRLMVSPREHELVFTIRDRTGTDYSFSERSSGLRYFLSYHVQLLAHAAPQAGLQEILLMDEPDAYLSNQGQQDLLRILEEFAIPEDGSRHDQVIYVTHSPFLINRNAASRIRVLDKGVIDEGTRVVKDAARNHYEPLRSSLGVFVAETSFISGANLFVEGLADQVLLAGVSSHLRRKGYAKTDTLDLNEVTIVPAGSASSVPYLVYLARGRDVVRPPCVVLVDSDKAGNDAVRVLRRGGPRGRQLLPERYILQVGTWADREDRLTLADDVQVVELEDLIPIAVAVTAARSYAIRIMGTSPEAAGSFVVEDVASKLKSEGGAMFKAVEAAFVDRFGPASHIEKVGFAKEVVAALDFGADPNAVATLEGNVGFLLAKITQMMRQAVREEEYRRLSNRLDRAISSFLADYPAATTREHGRLLVEEVESLIDESEQGDQLRLRAEKIRREFELDERLTDPIERFVEFREQIQALKYLERFANQDEPENIDDPLAAVDSAVGVDSQPVRSESSTSDVGMEASASGQAITEASEDPGRNGNPAPDVGGSVRISA